MEHNKAKWVVNFAKKWNLTLSPPSQLGTEEYIE